MTFPSLTQKQMLWPGASGSGAAPWVGHSSPSPCLCCLSNRCRLHTWSSEVNLFFFLILQKQIRLIANYIEMDRKDKCSDFLVPQPSPPQILYRPTPPPAPVSPSSCCLDDLQFSA